MKALKLFYSYSHKDEELRNELETHLSVLKRRGLISEWHDRRIDAGDIWAKEIDNSLNDAQLILLLVSADFLASDYCYSKEVKIALDRHEKGQVKVIPVILRPVEWEDAPFAKLQSLPKDAKAITLWANRDEAYANVARGIRLICQKIQGQASTNENRRLPKIGVVCDDVTEATSDILILKYAQNNYGVDAAVSNLLVDANLPEKKMQPLPGKFGFVESKGVIAADSVLFIGVLPLHQFDYSQIREFGNHALQVVARERASARHITLTMHGAGYGLDEKEAFTALLAGLVEGFKEGTSALSVEKVSIIERNEARAKRLTRILREFTAQNALVLASRPTKKANFEKRFDAGLSSGSKPHIFVAMPFTPEMEDVFIFGIQGPVQAAGYLCERINLTSFAGDVVRKIQSRIETAALVIGDLTGANPNVYLEVGYAWGKERPVLLVSNNLESLKFDLKKQNCIVYKTINELAKSLQGELNKLDKDVSAKQE